MGRLPSENPKRNRLELRLTDAELYRIDFIAKFLGVSRAEAITDTIASRFYELEQFLEEHPERRRP